jgi:hypothetical protein
MGYTPPIVVAIVVTAFILGLVVGFLIRGLIAYAQGDGPVVPRDDTLTAAPVSAAAPDMGKDPAAFGPLKGRAEVVVPDEERVRPDDLANLKTRDLGGRVRRYIDRPDLKPPSWTN